MVLPLAHFAPGPRVAPRGVSTSRQLLSSRPAESLSTRRGRGPAVTRPIGSDFGDIGRHSSGGDPDRGRRSAAARAADRPCPLRELCGAPPRRTQCVVSLPIQACPLRRQTAWSAGLIHVAGAAIACVHAMSVGDGGGHLEGVGPSGGTPGIPAEGRGLAVMVVRGCD